MCYFWLGSTIFCTDSTGSLRCSTQAACRDSHTASYHSTAPPRAKWEATKQRTLKYLIISHCKNSFQVMQLEVGPSSLCACPWAWPWLWVAWIEWQLAQQNNILCVLFFNLVSSNTMEERQKRRIHDISSWKEHRAWKNPTAEKAIPCSLSSATLPNSD